MTWTIPDKGAGQSDLQSILFREYLEVLVDGIGGNNCVLSGGGVTAQGVPDLTVAVAKAAVLSNGVLKPVTAGNVVIGAADATNPRIDLVVADSTGTKAVRAGTPAATPKPPVRTANDVVLAAVYVPANDTTISTNQITDMRIVASQGPVTIGKQTTAVTFNTTLAIQTYFSLVIPSGLFLAGKTLRVRCGGNYLANSGTPTWTLTITYGGTTMFADVTGATGTGAPRGAWYLDFTIQAQANNDQALVGVCVFQTPALKTAPTSGQAGDLAAATSIVTPLAGAAAVDSDAADRTLTVQWTMNVSNLADETVMEFATAVLE